MGDVLEGVSHEGRTGMQVWLSSEERALANLLLCLVTAMLQRVTDDDGIPYFVAKGGVLLQHVLAGKARPTRDIDGILRCGPGTFFELFEREMSRGWGPLSLAMGTSRNPCSSALSPGRSVPMLFDVSWNGAHLVSVPVDFLMFPSFSSDDVAAYRVPALSAFCRVFGTAGAKGAPELYGTTLEYEAATKLFLAMAPNWDRISRRGKDVYDACRLRECVLARGVSREALAGAFRRVLADKEGRCCAGTLDRSPADRVEDLPLWEGDYQAIARELGYPISAHEAAVTLNAWADEILGGIR